MQNEKINQVADYIFELVKKYHISIYNEDTGKGFLRHVVIRYGFFTDEVMVIFVTTEGKMYKKQEIIKDLTTKFKEIRSIIQNINIRETNAILGNGSDKILSNTLSSKIRSDSISKVSSCCNCSFAKDNE